MPLHLLPHLFKLGGPLAVAFGALGGYLWHPDCAPSTSTALIGGTPTQTCSNAWGTLDATAATDWLPLVGEGLILGALLGVAVAMVAVHVFGMARRDLGVEE